MDQTKQNIQNQKETNIDGILVHPDLLVEEAPTVIDVEGYESALNNLEPAGDFIVENQEELSQENLSSVDFNTQIISLEEPSSIEALGTLDETELDYVLKGNNTLINSDISILRADLQIDAITPVQNIIKEPEVETAPVITEIKLSNATTNQRFINNDDHYLIEIAENGRNQRLSGEETDIAGVSDNALIHHKLRAPGNFRIVLKSDWNSIKNVDVTSEELNQVLVRNFVHADVHLVGNADKTVRVFDAKRGFIETDDGHDVIYVKAFSNGAGWSNTFDIKSGAGDDLITIVGSKGYTIAEIDAGDGHDIVRMSGNYENSYIDLGHGNDLFGIGKYDDTVIGGYGDDIIRGRAGDDVIYGGTLELNKTASIDINDNDILNGGTNNDLITGGYGDDIVTGARGMDIAVFMGSIDEYNIIKTGRTYRIEDTVEGRDGTDTVRSIEGLLFGVEDLYLNILNSWTNTEVKQTFDVDTASEIDLSDLLESFLPVQEAIDNFVNHRETGQINITHGSNDIAALEIVNINDIDLTPYSDFI